MWHKEFEVRQRRHKLNLTNQWKRNPAKSWLILAIGFMAAQSHALFI
jgi:hypothetical protein